MLDEFDLSSVCLRMDRCHNCSVVNGINKCMGEGRGDF